MNDTLLPCATVRFDNLAPLLFTIIQNLFLFCQYFFVNLKFIIFFRWLQFLCLHLCFFYIEIATDVLH